MSISLSSVSSNQPPSPSLQLQPSSMAPMAIFSPSSHHTLIFPRTTNRPRQFRVWKRRRKMKPTTRNLPMYSIRSQSDPSSSTPYDDFFHNVLSHLPHSLNLLPLTALGLAYGLASFSLPSKLNSKRLRKAPRTFDLGDWILFTSPTPFNRFVLLRCPSVLFEGGQFLEDVSEKLVKQDRHYVKLDSGRIQVRRRGSDGDDDLGEGEVALEYSRICVGTDDGGVVSLDWPANLDLYEEHGLDSTILLVPGSAEGSMGENVKAFACECLKRGFFPVVMNPRGCAASPLTTPRLFSAADSNDISSAVQFLTRARPWSTVMAAGWGYGANMLTKYLAVVGEKTPLTAATCIDNPFDLDEVTRSSTCSRSVNDKLLGGLKDILRSNKELFQGRSKAFDVEKALTSESVRDFETAISMVSYGFNTINEFYEKSCTRSVVGDLKVPVLFIQSDDRTAPLFSIPRGLIAENPFTSLLLCSSLPSDVEAVNYVMSWCQELTVEWLAAVELALLKGRHPLLKDVDVTINPSKGLALVEGWVSDTEQVDGILNFTQPDNLEGYVFKPMKEVPEEDYTSGANLQSRKGPYNFVKEKLEKGNGSLPSDAESHSEVFVNPVEGDTGQVLQTAEVVMRVLDMTMPGTLKEEDKKKVLDAVGQGETLIKALQDAVPEDVRGKLTTSVSEIVQTHGKHLNFDALNIGQIANISSELKTKIERNLTKKADDENEDGDINSSQQKKSMDDMVDRTGSNVDIVDTTGGQSDNLAPTQEKSIKSSGFYASESVNQDGDTSLEKNDVNESQKTLGGNDSTIPEVQTTSEQYESGQGVSMDGNPSSQYASPAGPEDGSTRKDSRYEGGEVAQQEKREDNNVVGEVKSHNSLKNENKTVLATGVEEAISPSNPSGAQPSKKEEDDSKKRDDKSIQLIPDQNKPSSDSKSSTFSVSQALDALTGLDDSTQVAVNSVFGVIEEMINQLENKKEASETENSGDEANSEHQGSVLEDDKRLVETPRDGNETEEVSSSVSIMPADKYEGAGSLGGARNGVAGKEKDHGIDEPSTGKLVVMDPNGHPKVNAPPFFIAVNGYSRPFYHDYIARYALSKVKKTRHLDLDGTAALFLDYIPEDGQWKLLDQQSGAVDSPGTSLKGMHWNNQEDCTVVNARKTQEYIEPSYIIQDSERQLEALEELEEMNKMSGDELKTSIRLDEVTQLIKNVVLDSLKVEVSRRLNTAKAEEIDFVLATDMEEVANAVSLAVKHDKEHYWHLSSGNENDMNQGSRFDGHYIVDVISSAVKRTTYLRQILPVGVIVGSSLASLRNYFNVSSMDHDYQTEDMDLDQVDTSGVKQKSQLLKRETSQALPPEKYGSLFPAEQLRRDLEFKISEIRSLEKNIRRSVASEQLRRDEESTISETRGPEKNSSESANLGAFSRDTVVAGAVTAALGASALLGPEPNADRGSTNAGNQSKSLEMIQNLKGSAAAKLEEAAAGKQQNNIVTSLAEKAMSVAAPMVPTKEDGELDQERLVAMLSELGQKGGILRLVGKLALLWGGIRGAMSLTDRLIKYLRIAEYPLLHRILGFVGMVLVMWSPVVVPLMPTLFHNWATKSTSRMAQFACVIGLYAAVTLLIVLWGKRIRGYENPLQQYGLDPLSSQKIQDFLISFIGGIMFVLSIHSVNAFLGFVQVSCPSSFSSSSVDVMAHLKAIGKLLTLAVQGTIIATCVACVEELLYRSWLPEEISADFGYHRGIILSAVAFSLSQKSLQAIPGLWLLSLCLAGARERKQGSLYSPIGLRTGIISSCYVLHMGGFLIYQPNLPRWITGSHTFQPFSGIVGFLFCLLLAMVMYPREGIPRKNMPRPLRE